MAVVTHQPAPPASLDDRVPQELSDLVMKLLEKDAARRPASAGVVAEMLRTMEQRLARQAEENTVAIKAEPKAVPGATGSGRRRKLLVLALVVAAVVPLAWWLAAVVLRVETANGTLVVEMDDDETEARIKNGKLVLTGPDDKVRYTLAPSEKNKELPAGAYRVRVEGADGLTLDTPEFTLKKGEKVTVRVRAEARALVKAGDPDRRAAEWVLSIGGVVTVNHQDRQIKTTADLPAEPFRLTGVGLIGKQQVDDASLDRLRGCKDLTGLSLSATQVSDAGLAHLRDWPNLTSIDLSNNLRVGDKGLIHLKNCKNLTLLYLGGTKVSDAGLSHLKDFPNLSYVYLDGSAESV
jgi:hypothetical protein